MKQKPVITKVLSVRVLPNASPELLRKLKARKGDCCLGIFTADCDDVCYTAVDEATKKADVSVAYARSMYGGSGNASTALAGEFIGILSGPDPEEVKSGLAAAFDFIREEGFFYTANEQETVVYYAHCVSRTGTYLSKIAGIREGEALAYLIAPPLEATVGIDAALKAAAVKLKTYYGPPTETNFAGGLLTGSQMSCQAACDAFAEEVCRIAENPLL